MGGYIFTKLLFGQWCFSTLMQHWVEPLTCVDHYCVYCRFFSASTVNKRTMLITFTLALLGQINQST